MAIGVLRAEAELEAGAGVRTPDLGDGGEAAKSMGGASGRGGVSGVVHSEGLGPRDSAADGAVRDGGR